MLKKSLLASPTILLDTHCQWYTHKMSIINMVKYLKLTELIKFNYVSPSTQQNDGENTQAVIHVILVVR